MNNITLQIRSQVVFLLTFLLISFSSCENQQKESTKKPLAKSEASHKNVANVAPKTKSDSLYTFTWQDESCTNIGYFKAGAYTKKQLQDTYNLVNFPDVLTSTTALNFEDYNDSYFDKAGRDLRHEYDSLTNTLKKAQIVPTAFWLKVRELRTLELTENYQLYKFTLEGYYSPSSLYRNKYYSHCKKYADALASADTISVMRAWKNLIEVQKLNNGAPELLEERFAQESVSPARMKYAKLYLMTFGWYNCANHHTKYNDLYDQYRLRQNYHKLFKKVKSDCADVD
ncbi:hypothetical protein [Hymenobacter sp. BRD67]|uniref:hypothetical protein n=1 Tax=Hymenobacter sp. BRD67 TaxID=2675877 RepID=UPI001565492E|nr:hypothetical protein [Hymenobacter sp. BRD67]QKG51859.1 hypothetical protein GKZ67_03610 [Hymenobacter sp. BRD67]